MSSSTTATISGYYQSIQFRNAPTATLESFTSLVGSGAMTLAQVRQAIIDDAYTTNCVDPVLRLYQAAFGRVPENGGALDYYADRLADGRMNPINISQAFVASPEFQARYGADATPNAATITALYLNVLGRAPDQAGFQFYLTNGMTTAQMLQAFSQSPEFQTRSNAAVDAFLNANALGTAVFSGPLRIEVPGQTFVLTTGIDIRPGTEGNDTFVGTFDGAATSTSNLGDSIDGGAGVDTVRIISNANGTVVPTLTNVENLVLNDTVHEDRNVSGIAGLTSLELEQGTTIAAGAITLTMASGQSLTLDRVIDGDAGHDGANQGEITIAPSSVAMTALALNLESVGAQTGLTANNDVDLAIGGTSITTLNIAATGVNNISLANANNTITTVNVSGAGSLTVQGQGSTAIATVNASAATGAVTLNVANSGAANQVITGGSGNDTFTVNLARNINLNAGDGNDVVTLENATAANLSSTTGAADAINGGGGTDTLVLETAGAAALAGDAAADRAVLTGFEQLRLSNDGGAGTFNIANLGVNYLQLSHDTTGGNLTVNGFASGATIENRALSGAITLTLANVEATDIFSVVVNGQTFTQTAAAGANAGAIRDAAALALAASIEAAFGAGSATAAAGVITVAAGLSVLSPSAVDGGGGANTQTMFSSNDTSAVVVGMSGATGANTPSDTLNIRLNADLANHSRSQTTVDVAGINIINVNAADRDNTNGATTRDDGYVLDLASDQGVTTINVTGSSLISFTSTASSVGLTTFDASTSTGDLVLNLATGPAQGVSITGSAGTNTITGTASGDVITGGARADVITGGNGADRMAGGAGADTFVFAAGSSGGAPSSNNVDSITDFERNLDVIDHASAITFVAGGSGAAGQAIISARGIASFNAADTTLAQRITAVEAAISATGAPTTTAGEAAIFEFGGDSYVFVSDNAAGVGANDVLVRLTGVTGLTTSTLDGGNLLLG